MKRQVHVLMMAAALCAAVSSTARGEKASVLLEKGIYKEQTAGDIDAAIKIYRQIVKGAKANRKYVAEAQYRLGMCHLKKKDKTAAIAALREVVSSFGDQKAIAARAEAQLKKLGIVVGGPPSVVATTPPAFANNVDPSLDKMSVTFNQKMKDKCWAWVRRFKDKYPKTTGKPSFDAARTTCSVPVKLEPGKVYWVGINSPPYLGFRSPAGDPAKRYILLFATRTADGKPTPIPEGLLKHAKAINVRSAQAARALKLTKAPWSDGEQMRLKLSTLAGLEIGEVIYTARAAGSAKKQLWRIESYMVVWLTNMWQYTRVDAEKNSFAPVLGRTMNSLMGDYEARYRLPGKVALSSVVGGKKRAREVPVGRTAYDNEQVLFLMRRLPLAEGYETKFSIFPVTSGMVVDCNIKVVGKETVTVPAGKFECHKVDLSVGVGGSTVLNQKFWVSADKHRYLVKVDATSALMELVSVGKAPKKARTVRFARESFAVSVKLPAGWRTIVKPWEQLVGKALYVSLIPPEMAAWTVLTARPRGAGDRSARKVAEADVPVLEKYFKEYKVRPGSWKELEVSGLPAARYAADYLHKGARRVEYRTYILGRESLYWFVFRVKKDQFKAMAPVLDAIVKSFKVEATSKPPTAAEK